MRLQVDICIITALNPEAEAIRSYLTGSRSKLFLGLFSGYAGRIGERNCLVVVSGIGCEKSYLTVKQVAHLCQPELVINFGTAGSLSDKLEIGEVISSQAVLFCKLPDNYFAGLEREWEIEDIVVDRLEINKHVREFVAKYRDIHFIATGSFDRSITSQRLRQWLNENLGIMAADRETYGVLKGAGEENINALSLRVIADLAGDTATTEFYRTYQRVLATGAQRLLQLISDLPR